MKKILLRASLAVLLPTTSLLAVDSGLVRLLEVTATYGNTSKQEPETIGSILSSVRLADSLTSNIQEFFTETNKTGGFGYNPRIRYSQKTVRFLGHKLRRCNETLSPPTFGRAGGQGSTTGPPLPEGC
jgi:hypothetical protein